MSFPAQIHLRLWILEEGMFENNKKKLTFILTGEQQHQAKTFFHQTDTLPSQYYNNGMGEYLCMVTKLLGLVLMLLYLRDDQTRNPPITSSYGRLIFQET